jgi:hypothetical protein
MVRRRGLGAPRRTADGWTMCSRGFRAARLLRSNALRPALSARAACRWLGRRRPFVSDALHRAGLADPHRLKGGELCARCVDFGARAPLPRACQVSRPLSRRGPPRHCELANTSPPIFGLSRIKSSLREPALIFPSGLLP